MIHVGDKVRVAVIGSVYNTYMEFLDYFRDVGGFTRTEQVCSQYVYGCSLTASEAREKVFTVMFIREHGVIAGRVLAIINDGEKTFIIDVNALVLISSDIPFKEGDKVFIIDHRRVYSTWMELIKHASTVIPDGEEVYQKWVSNHSPSLNEEGGKSPETIFTVKWIGHHISRPNDDILVVISNNTHAYIMSTKGLARAGDSSWDKYVIYVRNWAVVNKDSAQSVRDATGPKPYAEWLNNKS